MFSRARPAGAGSAIDTDSRPARVSRRQGRTGGTVTRGFAAGTGLLARVVYLVVTVVVVIIVAGILLVVLKANPANSIVSDVHGWARSLAGPFDGMFSFHTAHVAIAVNWGIAAVVYALVGGLITRLLGRPRHYQLKRTHDQQDH
jgi:uncharacterized integral membrane protein